MRRVLTAVVLCFGAFAAVVGCQAEPPSKPCACPKGSGCQCPLSGPQHASGGANQGGAKTAKPEERVAQRIDHRRHREARAERERHRHLRITQRESEREARKEGRSGGALLRGYGAAPYDYHSHSHSYSLREGPGESEGSASEEQHAYAMHRHSHWMHRHMEEHGSESGNEESDSGYGEDHAAPPEGREYGPEDQILPESNEPPPEAAGGETSYAAKGQMSINSPTALDSWHGYDVECPEPR